MQKPYGSGEYLINQYKAINDRFPRKRSHHPSLFHKGCEKKVAEYSKLRANVRIFKLTLFEREKTD